MNQIFPGSEIEISNDGIRELAIQRRDAKICLLQSNVIGRISKLRELKKFSNYLPPILSEFLVLYSVENGWLIDINKDCPEDLRSILEEICLMIETQRIALERQVWLQKVFACAYDQFYLRMNRVIDLAIEKGVLIGNFISSDSTEQDTLVGVELNPCFSDVPNYIREAIHRINKRLADNLRGVSISRKEPDVNTDNFSNKRKDDENPHPNYPNWPEISETIDKLIRALHSTQKRSRKGRLKTLLKKLVKLEVFTIHYSGKKINYITVSERFETAPEKIRDELSVLLQQLNLNISLS